MGYPGYLTDVRIAAAVVAICSLSIRALGPRMASLILLLSVALMAYCYTGRQSDLLRRDPIAQGSASLQEIVIARVGKAYRNRLFISTVAVYERGEWQTCGGNVLVFLREPATQSEYVEGDWIAANLPIRRIAAPLHEGEFDFSRYWAYQNLFYQAFAAPDDIRLLHRPRFHPGRSMRQLQVNASHTLIAIAGNSFQQEIGPAMILGDKSGLTTLNRTLFAHAGAMHLLAVSGMHLGIVFLLIRGLGRMVRGRWRWLTEIVLIWWYALITGAGPSVLRAGLMLSVYTTARSLHRPVKGLQVIGVAAFFLLWQDPFLLVQTGFQLSCLAVWGINRFFNPIKQWWTPTGYLPRQAWSLTALSIAAQLGTLPLSTFYFGLIPIYALLSNLLLTPLSSVVLFSGLGIIVLPNMPWAQWLPQQLYNLSLQLMEKVVLQIANLPGAAIFSLQLSLAALLIAYAILLLVPWLWKQHKPAAVVVGLILCHLAAGQQQWLDLQHRQQDTWLIYTDKQQIRFARIAGKQAILFQADSLSIPEYIIRGMAMRGIGAPIRQKLPEHEPGKLIRICSKGQCLAVGRGSPSPA